MSGIMSVCKACGAEIAKSAKTCPHCGAKNKKGHPVLIGILAVLLLFVILGSAGGNETSNADQDGSAQTNQGQDNREKTKEENTFGVGETAEANDITVTMVNVTESTGSAYNKPTEGNVFVLCEFEIENNSKQEITVSSMMSFEAYCDDYTCNYSLSAIMEKGNKNQLDGTVAAGKKFNGVIGYEVPEDWEELEIYFTPDFWSGEDIIFLATND